MYIRKYDPNNMEIKTSAIIDELCKPLKDLLNINFFSFNRIYWDAKMFCLCNRPDWLKYFFDNELHRYNDILPDFVNNKVVFIEDYPKNSQVYQQINTPFKEKFNCYYTVMIPFHSIGYLDVIILSVPKEEIHFERELVSNLEIIQHFVRYFKEKAYKIIKQASKERYPLSESENIRNIEDKSKLMIPENKKKMDEMVNELNIKRFYLPGTPENIYFTKREMDCIELLVKDHHYTQIAKALNISKKTVYEYIENIKYKLKCKSKAKLKEKLSAITALESATIRNTSDSEKAYLHDLLKNIAYATNTINEDAE